MGGTKTGAQKAWKVRRKKYGPSGSKGEHHMKHPEHRQRMRDENPTKRPKVRAKISKALKGKPQPWMEGDNNPMKRPEVAAKSGRTRKGRQHPWMTGDKNPMRNPDTSAKSVRTKRERYGPSGVREPKTMYKRIWETRREWYGPTGCKIYPSKRPEVRGKIAEAHRGVPKPILSDFWNNLTPEEKHEKLQNSLFKCREKPNDTETKLIPILEDFGFTYFGWEKVVSGHYPDFVNENEYRIIEFDGFAGHNPSSPWTPDTWEECLAKDDKRDQSYRDAGYQVLRIFPEDLVEGDDFVRAKVEEWVLEG